MSVTIEIEGNAIVYCEGAFQTTYGKTAHGLVRFTRRYRVIAVVDSLCAGQDAAEILDGTPKNIPVFASVEEAVAAARKTGYPATHMVIGLATEGGYLPAPGRQAVLTAIKLGLNVDSGLHDFLTEDAEMVELAAQHHVKLRDIRKPPPRREQHFFSGKINEVTCLKVIVLGTDSAVGKRTTAWLIVQGLQKAGYTAHMVGTGQTAWMQGAPYSFILDVMVNDFLAGEIEHAVWSAWDDGHPDVIVIEGQGSMMNPAFPGGYELLAAGRPDVVILQHAPARREYDGFPGYPMQPITRQIAAIELVSSKPVIAITINHESLTAEKIPYVCEALQQVVGLPAIDVLIDGADELVKVLIPHIQKKKENA